ncbi:hypothetical protein QYM36_008084, partial [Artemia franciscana]
VSKASTVFRFITSKPDQWPKSMLDRVVIAGKLEEPLKSKHGSEVAKQLEQVFSQQTFKKIHTGRGKKFLNPSVKKTLEKYQIELYHTHSHPKASFVP